MVLYKYFLSQSLFILKMIIHVKKTVSVFEGQLVISSFLKDVFLCLTNVIMLLERGNALQKH